jgi:hypothetical protein
MGCLKSIFSLFFFVSSALLASPIDEEWLVRDGLNQDIKLILSQHPEIIIDHVESDSFEVYGPKGVGEFLNQLGLPLQAPKKINKMDVANYPTFRQVEDKLKDLALRFPQYTKLFSVGKSVKGKDLWVLKISDNPELDEVEPEFKYISSMHGDEITGRELMLRFAEEMLSQASSNSLYKELITKTEIFIMPSMNPDGSELRQRGNANRFDLNRNFPDFTNDPNNTTLNRQPETQAIMNFQAQRKFALSANFHGGSVVVNYPWDTTYDLHPFDDLVKSLSLDYADLNPAMRSSREFQGGIVNGANWYVVKGGMQDWSYHWYNDLQVTVELSDEKWPSYSEIPKFYQDNKDSIVAYLKAIHQGAGFKWGNVLAGSVEIKQNSKSLGSYAFSGGEFYKVLAPGDYEFIIKAAGLTKTLLIEVTPEIKNQSHLMVEQLFL